jgi:ATP-dependent RNA helicase DDX24/MAK5
MTQEHSFPQLIKILEAIHVANPREEDEEEESEDEDSEDRDDSDRLHGLPGVPGEAQLTMLTDDILKQISNQKDSTDPESMEVPDEYFPEDESAGDDELKKLEEDLPDDFVPKEKVHRQTFIYSATLTLPFTSTGTRTYKKHKKLGLDGGIAEILEKTRAMGETKVVDLSSSTSAGKSSTKEKGQRPVGVRLPPGLSLEQIKCTQKHKDSHLYAYLMTTTQGSSGPSLIFCNSIAAVRRVGATLQTLGFSVRILHAHMQQVRDTA